MQNAIKFKIKTLSNLFIGGAPVPFEIGGIDQQTALDQEGFPYIPGSSFKGALRTIVREDSGKQADDISELYKDYLEKNQNANQDIINNKVNEEEAKKRIAERYEKAIEQVSPEYLFGIEGFNNTPKLIFSDLLLCNDLRDKSKCFCIDMKNSIDAGGKKPVSNPRTYKTARSGLTFEGEIQLYKMELLGECASELCKKYVIYNLLKFNYGIYRLGNSKSRGYGRICITLEGESGVSEHESL